MKTNMRDTSLEAHAKLKESGSLERMELMVLGAINALNGATNRQIAFYLSLEINQVTGRTNSLVKNELVRSDGKVKNQMNNRSAHVWKVNNG